MCASPSVVIEDLRQNHAFGKDEGKAQNIRELDSTSLAYRRVSAVCIGYLMKSVRSQPLVNALSSDPLAANERTNE